MAEAYTKAAIPEPHAIILPNPPALGHPIYLFDRRVLEPTAAPPPRESPPQPLPQAEQVRPPPPRPPDCGDLAALLDAQHAVLQQMERGDQLLASGRQRIDAMRTAAARTVGAQRALGVALASLGGNVSRMPESGLCTEAWEVLASEARHEAEAKPEVDLQLAATVREGEADWV